MLKWEVCFDFYGFDQSCLMCCRFTKERVVSEAGDRCFDFHHVQYR